MINRSVFIGRLTSVPKKHKTKQGVNYCKFQLAVESEKGKADYPECIIFGQLADAFVKYLSKGDMVGVSARYSSNIYKKRKYQIFKVEEFHLLGSRKNYEEIEDVKIPQ